jgi:hypothetical protein
MMTVFDETTEQLRARRVLAALIEALRLSADHSAKRGLSRQIRDIARTQPWLADQLPDDVYAAIYRVGRLRARGTDAPTNVDVEADTQLAPKA